MALSFAMLNRGLDILPPGRWLHRALQRRLVFSSVKVPLRRPSAAGLNGLRIAFLSDIHAGSYLNTQDLCRLFAKVAEKRPHLVCLGGDLINTREREILMYRQALQLLSPELGIVAVPGNHDQFWGQDLGLWEAFLREQGVRVLMNDGLRLTFGGSSLWIAGPPGVLRGLRLRRPRHQPRERRFVPRLQLAPGPDRRLPRLLKSAGYATAVAGKWQLTLLGKDPEHPHRLGFDAYSHFGWHEGMFDEDGCYLYVGRGVGVTVLPLRIGARAEVPIIELVT